MKDKWYADNRDLIKWGGIAHLCNETGIKYVLQVAYYSKSTWSPLDFNNKKVPIPEKVLSHFRDIKDVERLGEKLGLHICVENHNFSRHNRDVYHKSVCKLISTQKLRKIVFLDPDTGIALQNAKAKHVEPQEVSLIWKSLKRGDFLVLYQHSFRKTGWKAIQRNQLAEACNIDRGKVMEWKAELARDVVFFFCEKQ
ncbi:MAG: hypothetical protein WCA51_02095 [Dehalococcoidia bacterium]